MARGRMLACTQGRRSLLRGRTELGHARGEWPTARFLGGHARRDPAHRAARTDRTLARLLFRLVLRFSESGVALRQFRSMRLPQQGMARLYGARARRRAR